MSARLVPELYCRDIARSIWFYRDVLGFEVLFERPENRFAYFSLGGAELMIEEPTDPDRTWLAGPLEPPFGRGMSLEIFVDDLDSLIARLAREKWDYFVPVEQRWYRQGDIERGNRQFVIQDPDGYLLRFSADLGARPVGSG